MGVSRSARIAALGAIALIACIAPTAGAAPGNDTSAELRRAVTVPGILKHELAFQLFAHLGTGNRLSGTPGYDDSAQYVANRMERAGYDVEIQPFEYENVVLADYSQPVLDVRRGPRFIPGIFGGQLGGDFGTAFSVQAKSADLTAAVWAVDLQLPVPDAVGASTSGCEATDFAGMPAGAIALVQRGTCPFVDKQENAELAGAGAVIVFNDGVPIPDDPRTEGVFSDATDQDIPVINAATRVGQRLANGVENGATGVTVRVRIDWRPGVYETSNVIAESPTGNPDDVVVVGAHLDSVGTGPGINDNGSGSAGILDIAEGMRKVHPLNKVRFIWFGAEESGLLGSTYYVSTLTDAERAQIASMLNFDMIGSRNFVRFVYDGDNTLGDPVTPPPGSAEIEALFLEYFGQRGLETLPTAFDGRSDYGPFIEVGIPAGGLFTGAEGLKTEEEAAIFGGVPGEQYDPCYHEGCDTILNLSVRALDQMSDAAAHATITLAQTEGGVPAAVAAAAAAKAKATAGASGPAFPSAKRPERTAR